VRYLGKPVEREDGLCDCGGGAAARGAGGAGVGATSLTPPAKVRICAGDERGGDARGGDGASGEATVVVKARRWRTSACRRGGGEAEAGGSAASELEPTETLCGEWWTHMGQERWCCVAAEMDANVERARAKLKAKGADAIVLNECRGRGLGSIRTGMRRVCYGGAGGGYSGDSKREYGG